MYLGCILMYLKCILNALLHSKRIHHVSWHFACILHVSQTSLRYMQDTHKIHHDTCILCASLMTLWIHIKIHQDTSCILDSSSRYIKIHRDTKSRYMYLGRVMTTLQDTIRIHKDTCKINQGYMRDKCICSGSRIHEGYMRDTSKIHIGIRVKYMQNVKIHDVFSWNVTEHLRYIWDTSRYTQDTCILQDTLTIHHDTSGYVSYRKPHQIV